MTGNIPFHIQDIMDDWGLEYIRSITEPSKSATGFASIHLVDLDGERQVLKSMPLGVLDVCYTRLAEFMKDYKGTHENIFLPSTLEARVYIDGEDVKDFAFLLSDYVPHHIRELEGTERRIPIDIISMVGYDVARGMEETHDQGYIHSDVKGPNVFIAADGTSKLADFDCAVRIGEKASVFGTPSHIAPEYEQGSDGGHIVSPSQDVFAFGTMLYKMIDGQQPYWDGTRVTPLVRHVPGDLGDLVMACTEYDKNNRPNASEVVKQLKSYASTRKDVAKRLKQLYFIAPKVDRGLPTVRHGLKRSQERTTVQYRRAQPAV